VLHKPIIEEMKGNDVGLIAVAELSNDIVLAIPRVDSLHNFLVRVSNLTKDEEENVSEEDSDNTSEDKAKDGEEGHCESPFVRFVKIVLLNSSEIVKRKREGR